MGEQWGLPRNDGGHDCGTARLSEAPSSLIKQPHADAGLGQVGAGIGFELSSQSAAAGHLCGHVSESRYMELLAQAREAIESMASCQFKIGDIALDIESQPLGRKSGDLCTMLRSASTTSLRT